MGRLLTALVAFLRRHLALFALIVCGLLLAPWIGREWAQAQRIAAELPALREAHDSLARRQAALVEALRQRLGALSGQPVARLDAEIRALEGEIATLERERQRGGLLAEAARGSDAMAARLRASALREVQIELRRQAIRHLLELRAHALVLADREAALRTLARLAQEHRAAYAAYARALQQLNRARTEAGWLARLAFTPQYRELKRLEQALATHAGASQAAHRRFEAQRRRLARFSIPGAAPVFRIDAQGLALAGAALREPLARAEQLASRSLLWRGWLAVRPVLPTALGLLLAWWLVPAAIRAFAYFVMAPLAGRRPPVVIGDRAAGAKAAMAAMAPQLAPGGGSVRISAVSHRVVLGAGDELLVRPAYCQSLPAGAHPRTALLFDWRRPLTSIAAHLWLLTRLRCAQRAEIVVSSTSDPLDELALVELASGEALVLQPRALVGLVHPGGQGPSIRSHWRIGSLHAWLTLQLRYLAFEGPAILVVKGCRGVRIERAASGRMVSQAATLGFSANARYGTVRAEPFLPYLRGVQPLFNDRFEGDEAYYLYEEVPRNARARRGGRNPLEMLAEAGLKAFGI